MSPHAVFVDELCQASARWLRGVEIGDAAARHGAVADMHTIREKGEAAGLGNDGDFLLIADRMVAAAEAGDAVGVSAERGACP